MEHVFIEISRPAPSGYAGGADLDYELNMGFDDFIALTNAIEKTIERFCEKHNIEV